jgi:hypothetical protein
MGTRRKRRRRKFKRSKGADLMASVWAQVVVVGMVENSGEEICCSIIVGGIELSSQDKTD